MIIALNTVINNVASPARQVEVRDGLCVSALLNAEYPGHTINEVLVNGRPAHLTASLQHADAVSASLSTRSTVSPAAPVSQGATIKVLYLDNVTGTAPRIDIPQGMTLAQFLNHQGVSTEGVKIRVNGQPATQDQVLNNGDKISLTPMKIEGAATVRYLNCDGSGFAKEVDVIDGITLLQFFLQQSGGADIDQYKIRVNGDIAAADQVLNSGDTVVAEPFGTCD
jgi:sulfur carrier protein ThiS